MKFFRTGVLLLVVLLAGGGTATAQTLKWLKESAAKGNPSAQYKLGVRYDRGLDVDQDHERAARWWKLAARQGHAEAQFHLGWSYAIGKGVPQDFVFAHMWIDVAASQGVRQAKQALRALEGGKRLSPSTLARAQELAQQCVARGYRNCG